jgi:UDP-N-acetylmuramoylalanine--D-glutamate ligase
MRELMHSGQLKGHRVVVVGAGRSGRAAAALLGKLGAEVLLLEKSEKAVEAGLRDLARQRRWTIRTGEHTRSDFADADLIVLSPGVPRRRIEPLLPERNVLVVSEIELGSWFVDEPIIGVTGTNGKSTTTMLIAHGLESAGIPAFAGGNLGTPLCEYVTGGESAQVLVLEVSSFQLQNVSAFHPRVGVLLNFTPNHLDYHTDMEEYLEAKLRLFARQTPRDLAILPLALKETLEGRTDLKASRTYFVAARRFDCPQLPGRHNQENMEAAFLACRFFGVSEEQFQEGLESFIPLPHRLQRVGERSGVVFIDDSKATTVDALRVALETVEGPVHLLAGGIFKGGELSSLAPLIQAKVKSLALFGGSREIFEQAFGGLVPVSWDPTLREAVHRASLQAVPGETILLAPATSSFDQFADYKERGKTFQEAAREVITAEEMRNA